MKALKGILIGLVITLVVILVAGGALIGFNHEGHTTDDTTKVATENNNANNNEAHQNQENQQNEQKTDGKQEKVVVAKEQLPPEEYLKKIQEAQALIKEASGLMANDAYMGETVPSGEANNKTGTDSKATTSDGDAHQMDKMHQGIYKMAQGMTLMDIAVEGMSKEIQAAKGTNSNFYAIPSNPAQNFYYNPYLNGYYYQNPYQYPNYPNGNNSQNSSNDSNSHTTVDPSQTDASHSAHSSTGGLLNAQTIVYGIYGFLIISMLGVFIAIFGFIKSLLKPSSVQE